MKKGCIFLISARKYLLKDCLKYLDQNYNKKFNYPILIFYHGNIYNNKIFRNSIRSINQNTEYRFHKIESKLPSNIKVEDLFWNLDNPYARNFKGRIGYLHANYFWNNFMNYKELSDFDYLMRIDDDSWFKEKIDFDFFEELDNKKAFYGTAYTWNHYTESQKNTRINLYIWINEYIKKNKLVVKHKQLRDSLKGEKDNNLFHTLNWSCGNCNIYKKKMFQSANWKRFNKEFNKIAGGYRYRWGDCEVISLYAYIHLNPALIDFDLRSKKIYEPQLPDTKMVLDRKFHIKENIKIKIKNILKLFKIPYSR